MNINNAIEVIDRFYDLKVTFAIQSPKVDAKVLTGLQNLRDWLQVDCSSDCRSFRLQFLSAINVMLATTRKTSNGTNNQFDRNLPNTMSILERGVR